MAKLACLAVILSLLAVLAAAVPVPEDKLGGNGAAEDLLQEHVPFIDDLDRIPSKELASDRRQGLLQVLGDRLLGLLPQRPSIPSSRLEPPTKEFQGPALSSFLEPPTKEFKAEIPSKKDHVKPSGSQASKKKASVGDNKAVLGSFTVGKTMSVRQPSAALTQYAAPVAYLVPPHRHFGWQGENPAVSRHLSPPTREFGQ